MFDAIYTQAGSGVTMQLVKTRIDFHRSIVNKVEVNNQGSVFVSSLKSLGANVSGYVSKGGKHERIYSHAHFIEFLHFVENNNNPEYQAAVKHLESFPKNGKAEDGHDDAEDALTEGLRYIHANFKHLFLQKYA